MSNEGSKGFREEIGQGYLSLLDSVRHSFEQAAWGQETSGNLADDFYRWVGPAENAPKAMDAAELGGGVEVRPAEAAIGVEVEPFVPSERDWKEFEAWIDGKLDARSEPQLAVEHERDGPELGE